MPKPRIDFDILRLVAETASAFRYKDTWVVVKYDPSGRLVIEACTSAPDPVCDDSVVYFVEKVSYGQPPAVSVAVIGSGTRTVNLLAVEVPAVPPYPAGTYAADAVFWSQSAVEKFLIPYYASVYGDRADTIVQRLLNVLKPPSQQGSEPDEDPAFAIAHLPGSEYVTLDGDPVGLFMVRKSGSVEAVGRR